MKARFIMDGGFAASFSNDQIDLTKRGKGASQIGLVRLLEHMCTLDPLVRTSPEVLDLDWVLTAIVKRQPLSRVRDFGVWHEV